MKKLKLMAMVAFAALLFTSCHKMDYKSFVGTWGVEKIEYYNIDYAGNPIAGSLSSFEYDPYDADNSIRLVFKDDQTGEMRDSAIDTIWTDQNEQTGEFETVIVCPDTVLVTTFTCSYDKNDESLFMIMEDDPRPYRMRIVDFNKDSFVYENEYGTDYVEKAYLKRISKSSTKSTKSANHKPVSHPHNRPGSLFGRK